MLACCDEDAKNHGLKSSPSMVNNTGAAGTSGGLVTPRLLNNLYSFCEKSCFVVVVNYSWLKIS